MSEKTHEPTAQKLAEARKKGQIPKSKLFSSAGVTLGGLIGTTVFAEDTGISLTRLVQRLWVTPPTIDAALRDALLVLAKALAPTLVGALLGALLTSLAMTGLGLMPDAVKPDLNKLNPFEGAKKLFKVRQLIDVGKGLVVAGLVGAVMFSQLESLTPLVLKAWHLEGLAAMKVATSLLVPPALKCAALLLALGLADWALAKRRHIKDLMMSHDEVKQEHKNSEGDPHHKAKRKSLHKQLSQGGPARGTKAATAVVVNPTHIAIALRYAPEECEAPYIVAKGTDAAALAIRTEANSRDIPIIKDIPFARTLIHYDVGEEVPEELYQAAAAILKVAMDRKEDQARLLQDPST
jgi:type III secretion protein U